MVDSPTPVAGAAPEEEPIEVYVRRYRGRKAFMVGTNKRPEKFWRAVNELPFLAAIAMVLAVTLEFGK